MVEQETSPTPWIEEEVSEAYLPHLGWHAEAKAERAVTIRGGVLADEGTTIQLAIIFSPSNSFCRRRSWIRENGHNFGSNLFPT
jgi:hypothetical protein